MKGQQICLNNILVHLIFLMGKKVFDQIKEF